nr:RNA-directed DNA polymerase, eukaryota, reverse transcriptase zinc-binding domain protein [Tanacetum cinerariifolium]
MGGGSVNLSYMFYADDAVFIGQWCESNITTLVHVLECFHKASGLRINMCKSKIMGVHVDGDMVKNATKKLRCLVLKTPFSYLGSIVGRSTIPVFNVSIFKVLRGVLRELEGIRRQFFNGHEPNRKFCTQGNSLWARIIKAIHGVNEGVGVNSMVRKPSCWMSIIKEMDVSKTKGIDLMKHMRIKVGNGESTSFWEDKWCDAGVLKDKYPRAFALGNCKSIKVATKLSQPGFSHSFRRIPRGGCEQNQVNELEDLMRLVVLSPIEDRWMWGLKNSGLFSVASIRRYIDDKMLSGWKCKTRWINYVPIKVNVLAWKVMTDSLPTRFNILRRGIPIDSILCVNCDMGVETSRHLFFSCCMAKEVTNLIARWWDVPEPECESYEEWLVCVTNVRLPLKNKNLFEGVFYVLWWFLWWFRNKSIFGCNSPKKALFFD